LSCDNDDGGDAQMAVAATIGSTTAYDEEGTVFNCNDIDSDVAKEITLP
jgi:hypothetical protein